MWGNSAFEKGGLFLDLFERGAWPQEKEPLGSEGEEERGVGGGSEAEEKGLWWWWGCGGEGAHDKRNGEVEDKGRWWWLTAI